MLFGKLQQGVQENQQILTVARMRAEAEDVYGQKLGEIEVATLKIDGGFSKDDGASVKKVRRRPRGCLCTGHTKQGLTARTGLRRGTSRDD